MKSLKNLKNMADYYLGMSVMGNEEMEKKLTKVIARYSRMLSMLTLAVVLMSASTFLVSASSSSVASASELMGSILGVILAIFRYVGIALIVWGVVQFVMATKRTDAESKSDAIQTIMCGIVLTSLKTVFNSFSLGIRIADITL